MKNYSYFFIITYFIIATTSYAMEKQLDKSNILKELTNISNIRHVQYLTNDDVMISGDGCCIINVRTDKEKNISDELCTRRYSFYLDVRHDKKKIALNSNNVVTIYDIKTGKIDWSREQQGEIKYAKFNPFDHTIFVCHDHYSDDNGYHPSVMMKCNYVTNSCEDSGLIHPNYSHIAIHPIQPIMCVIDNNEKKISTYNLNDLKNKISEHNFLRGDCFLGNYSPDGYFFAGGNDGTIVVIDLHSDSRIVLDMKKEFFLRIAFLNKEVLATLSKKLIKQKFFMHYWDIKTKEIIYTVPLLNGNQSKNFYVWNFSFSPDKTKVAVATGDRCIILPVPLEVIYEAETKEKLLIRLFLLNQLEQQKNLPKDVVQCFKNDLLQTFKR